MMCNQADDYGLAKRDEERLSNGRLRYVDPVEDEDATPQPLDSVVVAFDTASTT